MTKFIFFCGKKNSMIRLPFIYLATVLFRFCRSRLYLRLRILFFRSLIGCLCLHFVLAGNQWLPFASPAHAQTASTNLLVQAGLRDYQNGNFQGAIATWQQATSELMPHATDEAAIVLQYLADAYQQLGNQEQAIIQLDQAITVYRQVNNTLQVGRLMTAQAQAYSELGHHRQALRLLCNSPDETAADICAPTSALGIAQEQADALGEAAALGSLGNTYRLQGRYEPAIQAFTASLAIATQLSQVDYQAASLNGLGNVYTSLVLRSRRYRQLASQSDDKHALDQFQQAAIQQNQAAITYYERSLELNLAQNNRLSELQTRLNLIESYYQQQRGDSLDQLNSMIQAVGVTLNDLPDSRQKGYGLIRLANLSQRIDWGASGLTLNPATQCASSPWSPTTMAVLQKALEVTNRIQDLQGKSFALGQLGHVYECQQDYDNALDLTRQAQMIAVSKESQYLWSWQTGRVLNAMGQTQLAIAAYEQAVAVLEGIQGDIAIANRDLQLDFRDTVDVVYRQLTELRFDQATTVTATVPMQETIATALETLDKLRLTELQNYLGDECELTVIDSPITLIDDHTAVFSSIIFADRTAVVATLPNGEGEFNSTVHWLPLEQTAITAQVNDFRRSLEQRADRQNQFKQDAQQFYDWLIRPFSAELAAAQIDTLVFLQDGILRSLPMAVLLDGDQFLIEQYAIANAPSLALTNPTPIKPSELQVLAFGLTEPAAISESVGFSALRAVATEIDGIKATLPGSKGFLNQDFSRDRLQQELEQNTYSVLHLATHAQFGFDARDTFLVTGRANLIDSSTKTSRQAFNETLTMGELYQMLRRTQQGSSPLALLTLTACETAVGSDRDALGIAGIALHAGAQSAVASLWQVDDEATAEIITEFYRGLSQGLSRAKALQAAQTTWLEANPRGSYRHPGYWAAFILIGNWL